MMIPQIQVNFFFVVYIVHYTLHTYIVELTICSFDASTMKREAMDSLKVTL